MPPHGCAAAPAVTLYPLQSVRMCGVTTNHSVDADYSQEVFELTKLQLLLPSEYATECEIEIIESTTSYILYLQRVIETLGPTL